MKMWSASLEFQMENDLLTDFFLPQIADILLGLLIYIRHCVIMTVMIKHLTCIGTQID